MPVLIAEALTCLALNLYHEARGEGPEGMAAVAVVTLNRVQHPDWPDTICEVVHQPAQFSWTRHGDPPVTEDEAWQTARHIAADAVLGELDSPLDGHVLFFHAATVRPTWAEAFEPVGRIGNHVFYAPSRQAPYESLRPVARPEQKGPQDG
jgi:N-acetylmuramoyl-L-alanine amidase